MDGGWIQIPHSFLNRGPNVFFELTMRSESRVGSWFVCNFKQTFWERQDQTAGIYFSSEKLKCKQCSSAFPPSVSCSFCLP